MATFTALALLLTLVGCEFRKGDPAGDFESSKPGVLIVATEEVPEPGFWEGTADDPEGGFEYELAVALANRFGLDSVEVRTVPFPDMVAGDLAGADLGIRQLTPTSEREEVLDFSNPYLSAAPGALVRSGTSIPDMKTARETSWAVAEGTTLVSILEDEINPETIEIAPDRVRAIDLLESGEVDAVLLDLPVALAQAEASDGRLSVAAQFGGNEALAIAMPDGSPNVEAVNSAIRALAADGTISELAEEWLGTSIGSSTFTVPDVPLIR